MKKLVFILFFLILSTTIFSATVFLNNKTEYEGKIIIMTKDYLILKENGVEKQLKNSKVVLILFDRSHKVEIRNHINRITDKLNQTQKSKSNLKQNFFYIYDQNKLEITSYLKTIIWKINNLDKTFFKAIILNKKYYSLRKYFVDKKFEKLSVHFFLYSTYLDFEINFPYHQTNEAMFWGEGKSKVKGPYINLGILSYGFGAKYIGFGLKVFQYTRNNISVKNWIPINLWIPIFSFSQQRQRSDLFFKIEWGYLPYSDYRRYLDMRFEYIQTFFKKLPILPVKVSLGAIHTYREDQTSWDLYFSLTFGLGVYCKMP